MKVSAKILLICLVAVVEAIGAEFPPPSDLGPVHEYGYGLQRTFSLLETSTPEQKNTVKILFYGQSITGQRWSTEVGEALKERYPDANLIITNRSIPGFSSSVLVKTAETDLYSFYPDLLIFHVYGPVGPYEKIIANVRSRTTADILIQTDHPVFESDLVEPTTAIPLQEEAAWRNYVFLPEITSKYGAELVDIRTYWKQYLTSNNYSPATLLSDHIHLNEHGNYLMEQLVSSHLRLNSTVSPSGWERCIQELVVGQDVFWSNGVLRVSFEGNRVDIIENGEPGTSAELFIDGKRPSQFPELYSFTRVSRYPESAWPVFIGMSSRAPLVEEEWTLKVVEYQTNNLVIRFTLSGSVTGPDGEGASNMPFVSRSGRVVIEPSDWMNGWTAPAGPLPAGHEVTWRSEAEYLDRLEATLTPGPERVRTVAQGLSNGPHELVVAAEPGSTIKAIRIYNPLARTQPVAAPMRIDRVTQSSGRLDLRVTAGHRYLIEKTDRIDSTWQAFSAPLEETSVSIPIGKPAELFRLRKL